ncbi:MAG: hypothetical protein NXI01_08545, partial [Gammaproteobacteria bacterium]|nr:hypothetical protein [Gammaproteobacteria bacterium]
TALQADLEQAHEALQTAALEAQHQQTQLQVQITELETVVETLQGQVTDVTTQLEEQARAAAELRIQLSEVTGALQNAQSATAQDTDTIKELTTERDVLIGRLNELEQHVDRLNADIWSFHQDNLLLQENARQQQAQRAIDQETLDALQEVAQRLERAQSLGEQLVAELEQEKAKVSTLENQVRELEEGLRMAGEDYEQIQAQNTTLNQDLAAAREELMSNTRQQASLVQELTNADTQNEALETELAELKRNYPDLMKRYQALQQQSNDQQSIIAALDERISSLQADNARLTEEAETARRDSQNDPVHMELLSANNSLLSLQQQISKMQISMNQQDRTIAELEKLVALKDARIREVDSRCENILGMYQTAVEENIDTRDALELARREIAAFQHTLHIAAQENERLRQEKADLLADKQALAAGSAYPRPGHPAHGFGGRAATDGSSSFDDDSEYSSEFDDDYSDDGFEIGRKPFMPEHDQDRRHLSDLTTHEYEWDDPDGEELEVSRIPIGPQASHQRGGLFPPPPDSGGGGNQPRTPGALPPHDGSSPHHPGGAAYVPPSGGPIGHTVGGTTASANVIGIRELPDVKNDIDIGIAAPGGIKDPNYSNDIVNTTRGEDFVRLAAVDPADATIPPKKLLDATVDSVTVYRRFTEDPTIHIEERAAVILKSLGIPASPGFELPESLVINGKNAIGDFTDNGSDRYKVIASMFAQYEDILRAEHGHGHHSTPVGRGGGGP